MAGQGTRALRAGVGIALAIAVVVGADAALGLAHGVASAGTVLRIADVQAEKTGGAAAAKGDAGTDPIAAMGAEGAKASGGAETGMGGESDAETRGQTGSQEESENMEGQVRVMFSLGLPSDAEAEPLKGEHTGKDAVPSWFLNEIGLPDGARDIRVSEAEDVVGCAVDDVGGSAEVFALICGRLADAGWAENPTGVEGCSVFTKREGVCRWAMVSCIQVGDATSVVVRCLTE